MRVYLPVTLDELQGESPVRLAPRAAHAVTPALQAQWPDEDEEGWEYAAQAAAADASLELLRDRPDAPRLRVVVAADVPEGAVRGHADVPVPSGVVVDVEVGVRQVVSVHVDEPEAAGDVAGVLRGDEESVERLEDRDLLWYDVSEIGQIPAV